VEIKTLPIHYTNANIHNSPTQRKKALTCLLTHPLFCSASTIPISLLNARVIRSSTLSFCTSKRASLVSTYNLTSNRMKQKESIIQPCCVNLCYIPLPPSCQISSSRTSRPIPPPNFHLSPQNARVSGTASRRSAAHRHHADIAVNLLDGPLTTGSTRSQEIRTALCRRSGSL